MSGVKSAEESRLELIAAMGQELGELFDALSSELTWIHWQWHQFRVLFGTKESTIELLNEAAPVFFRAVQDVFFEETVLAIARIVDPPATAGKTNLSVTEAARSDRRSRDGLSCREPRGCGEESRRIRHRLAAPAHRSSRFEPRIGRPGGTAAARQPPVRRTSA